MKKILIPVDFSEYSEKGVEEGKKIARAFNSQVVLLHVLTLNPLPYRYKSAMQSDLRHENVNEKERMQAEEALNEFKESFGDLKDKVETMVVHGYVADEILKVINETDVDLVVMGSYGIGSTIYRSFVGSVANKVVHHSLKPILILR